MEEMHPLIKNVSLMLFRDGGFSLMLGKCEHDAFFSDNYFNVVAWFNRLFLDFPLFYPPSFSLILFLLPG